MVNERSETMRYSTSPELLKIGEGTYTPESFNATTFLILEDVVVHSREFHMTIINGLRAMTSAKDLKTAKGYNIKFSARLTQSAINTFKERWVGTLGIVRINNKAGRVWKHVKNDLGDVVSVISFWGAEKTITAADLELLRKTFSLTTEVIVEYQGRKNSLSLPGLRLGL